MGQKLAWGGFVVAVTLVVACHGVALQPYGCAEPDHGTTIGAEVSTPRYSCDGDTLVTQPYRCDEADGPVPDGDPQRTDCTQSGQSCITSYVLRRAACGVACKTNADCPASMYCETFGAESTDTGWFFETQCVAAPSAGAECAPDASDTNNGARCAPGLVCTKDADAGSTYQCVSP